MKSVVGLGFLAVSLLLIIGPHSTAAGVQWLEPLPQGNDLQAATFLDETTAIAVGSHGTVMVTRDGGTSWSVSYFDLPTFPGWPALKSVSRVDATTAFAAGTEGFYRTTDAGHTWTHIEGSTLSDADFEGGLGIATSPYLNGPPGLFRSVDGGQSWSVVLSTNNIQCVDVVSSTLVVAVGNTAFFRSTDAGTTWTTLPFSVSDIPSSVSFIDELHGAVTALGDRLYVTSDGGATWVERMLDPVYPGAFLSAKDVMMLDPNTLYVAAQNDYTGQFLRSSDGGVTWDSDFGPRIFQDLARAASGVVLLPGDGGTITRWTPGVGILHLAGSSFPATDDVGRCAFLDSNHGIMIGSREAGSQVSQGVPTVVLRTSDGGQTWTSTNLTDTHLTDVAVTNSAAYAVGSAFIAGGTRNVLLKSVDGGQAWTSPWSNPISSPKLELEAIAFSSPTHGIAVGNRGAVLRINNDAGTSGSVANVTALLLDVALADDNIAVTVGHDGNSGTIGAHWFVYRTIDGGTTWTFSGLGVPSLGGGLTAVAFASPQVCVAGGKFGHIFRSEDAGVTWNEAFVTWPVLLEAVWAIAFSSSSHGLAVGGGCLAETWDGGQTWAAMRTPSESTRGVACFDPFRTVITGAGLRVIQYTNGPVPTLISSFTAAAEPFAVTLRWSVREASTPSRIQIDRRVGDVIRTVADQLDGTSRTYRDENVVPGTTYEYTLRILDEDGSITSSPTTSVTIPRASLELLPNQPNPFNPLTTIRFVVPQRDHVRLSIYDVAGHHVATLVDDVHGAGTYSVQWNGMDSRGESVASGVYLSRLESGRSSVTRKMLLLK